MTIWRIIFSRLKKHSFHHLIIPLAGGILVEFIGHKIFPAESRIVAVFGGVFVFRTLSLVLGVFVSWLIVMLLVINHETKKRITRRNLMKLEKRLRTATSYYGVSIISLADWFDPGSQLYLAKLLKRKLETDDFEHDRTLVFFSNRELKNTRVPLMDENYYGRCLAFMHGDYGIPLSFLTRKDIFEILENDMTHEEKAELGCYPRWTTWRPFTVFQKVPLRLLRRRIPQLDFALVKRPNVGPSVFRVRKSAGELRIEQGERVGEDASTYMKLVKLIRDKVYDQGTVRDEHDFVTDYGTAGRARRRPERDYRKILVEQRALKSKAQFRIKKYTRFVEIAEKSGDISVREEFEGVTAYPLGSVREKLPRTIISRFGYLREPQIEEVEGAELGWEWEPQSPTPGAKRGFITFDPVLEDEPLSFVFERTTHNAIAFNQRDRQGPAEEVSGNVENLIDLYVLKVRFPKRYFPRQFKIHVTGDQGKRDFQEEKLALTRFARFGFDSTAILILDRPLPGYTYRIMWTLPKDDIDELNLSNLEAQIVREANRRLLDLSSDTERAKRVGEHLCKLQKQIANARIGPYFLDDPELEVALHAYSDVKNALVMVASNAAKEENIVEIGTSTVGQAYKRRALVNWSLASNAEDPTFWDYSKGHTGIVSIPLFFPLNTNAGGRTCVLSIATRSSASGFLNVMEEMADRKIRRVFTQHVTAWYAKSLASALGLPDLSKRTLISPR